VRAIGQRNRRLVEQQPRPESVGEVVETDHRGAFRTGPVGEAMEGAPAATWLALLPWPGAMRGGRFLSAVCSLFKVVRTFGERAGGSLGDPKEICESRGLAVSKFKKSAQRVRGQKWGGFEKRSPLGPLSTGCRNVDG
jgi:hypothetical protein